MSFPLAGYVFDDNGNGINGATVKLLPNGSSTPDQTTTTVADGSGQNGYWTFTAADKQYNIQVDYQGHTRKFFSPSMVQFNNLVVGINAFNGDLNGNVTMNNPATLTDQGALNSPLLKLQGSYDSNASVGPITQTTEYMGLRTVVTASTGAYKLSFRNNSDTEKASLDSAGLFNVVSGGDIQINAVPVLTTITSPGATISLVKTANSYTADVAANTVNQKVKVDNNGSLVGTRKEINFIPGTNISYTIADNAGSDRVDVTITGSGTISGTAGGVTNAVDAVIRADDDVNGTGTVILETGNTNQVVVANGGDTTFTQNILWKSGTSFAATLDHANSAARTYTFQNSSDTIVGRATTDTLTNKTLTAPTITGTVAGSATYDTPTLTSPTVTSGLVLNSGNLTFNTTGQFLLGDFSNATHANRTLFKTTTTNGTTVVGFRPDGSGTAATLNLYNLNDPDNCSLLQVSSQAGAINKSLINTTKLGTGTTHNLAFQVDGVDKISLDTTGRWDMTSSPGIKGLVTCRAYQSANQNILNNTWTTISLNTENWNVGGMHSTVTNPSRMTAPVEGFYAIGGGVFFASNATGSRSIRLWMNGGTYVALDQRSVGSADAPWLTLNTIHHFFAGDYVELQVWQNSGGTLGTTADSGGSLSLWMHQLSVT